MGVIKPETIEQIKIVNWVHQCTDLPIIYIENEGKRSYVASTISKKMGLFAGAADLFIPRANTKYHGLFIEVKSNAGKISPNQQRFSDLMFKELFKVVFAFGADEGIQSIKDFYSLP